MSKSRKRRREKRIGLKKRKNNLLHITRQSMKWYLVEGIILDLGMVKLLRVSSEAESTL
jgi:hypothetical protein